jgi:vancomycin resistance protein YoaR
LLAGLEIIEFRPHSLPVSYIEPSFDAMVSFGSSDLKIRNNSGGQIIITTSSENDLCKVKIFGLKNRYKITRHSEKIGIVKAEKDIIETDYERYGESLEIGEKKRLSFSKDGYISRGYLNYYNENGKLVKTTMIRENKYNATKGVILKREN